VARMAKKIYRTNIYHKVTKHTEKAPLSMKHFVVFVFFVVKTLVVSQTPG
jgi:hypothetical protein